jgi:hypothetical protein
MNTGSSIFMLIGASGLVIFLGLPLLLFPIAWGRILGWTIPEQTNLTSCFPKKFRPIEAYGILPPKKE